MSIWGLLWVVWGVMFFAVEIPALRDSARLSTLTQFVQRFRAWRIGSLDVGRYLFACGWLWLSGHFFGWW